MLRTLWRTCLRPITLATCLACAVAPGPAWTQTLQEDWQEASRLYQSGDVAGALKAWQSLAEAGDGKAQQRLGLMYFYGEGVAQDAARAAGWFRRAAPQGHAEAQYILAMMLAYGAIKVDMREAVRWFGQAAQQGDARAQYELGLLYYDGDGVAKDDTQAARWYRAAAEQGHASAQYNLGYLTHAGEGVERNLAQAAQWYLRAAQQGQAKAQYAAGVMLVNGLGVAKNKDEAIDWFARALAQGHAGARDPLCTLQPGHALCQP